MIMFISMTDHQINEENEYRSLNNHSLFSTEFIHKASSKTLPFDNQLENINVSSTFTREKTVSNVVQHFSLVSADSLTHLCTLMYKCIRRKFIDRCSSNMENMIQVEGISFELSKDFHEGHS